MSTPHFPDVNPAPTGKPALTGAQIRQMFIDYFAENRHTFVPSASLVPGGDATLLFTNAGMVQFKEVFLGTDKRPYRRAVNSQKCMRVAGKHNDLDDVGRDDTHHTFFEMLGNWSFGDYYKNEAIAWSWQLLTEVWKLPKERLYATCFQDDKGNIPADMEAAEIWKKQPGMIPENILFFGRKENFWEMAETGPCGPCSEIHIDRGPEYCNMQGLPHRCTVNGDCTRYLELWNNVFIQYNRLSPTELEPLPAKHVDTGMGFERIVSVLQEVSSNYRTDLLWPLVLKVQEFSGHTDEQREANFTPYRVIADHARAAAFLIADGVVPGNVGRNYICRMIIRRAARFGSKLGLNQPFLAAVADKVIEGYGDFYPELVKNRQAILDNLTREEKKFQRTVEGGMARLEQILRELQTNERGAQKIIPGEQAFDLYATYGLPLELTRDVAREQGLDVDEPGFRAAMETHRLVSSGGAFGEMTGDAAEIYTPVLQQLQKEKTLGPEGVTYDPYRSLETQGNVLALVVDGLVTERAESGDQVEIVLPATGFYVESGGQVSDTGLIRGLAGDWEVSIREARRPIAGIVAHVGEVVRGEIHVGDQAWSRVDTERRRKIMRNHTATHLLHAALHHVLGEQARQAGSLVAPERLRFDFNHPQALTGAELEQVEQIVNARILENHPLQTALKPLQQAIAEGATALFGEKYGETVRNVTILENGAPGTVSNELCGGTHCEETGDIGLFLIVSEGSVASGVRRIEAVTGSAAYELVLRRFQTLKDTAVALSSSLDETPQKALALLEELSAARKQIAGLRRDLAAAEFNRLLADAPIVAGVPVMTATLPGADADTLRQMTDLFRARYASGVAALASINDGKPSVIVSVSDDLVKRGLHAGELVKFVAAPLGGGGGGRPNLAQAGGKDASKVPEALASVPGWVAGKLSA